MLPGVVFITGQLSNWLEKTMLFSETAMWRSKINGSELFSYFGFGFD